MLLYIAKAKIVSFQFYFSYFVLSCPLNAYSVYLLHQNNEICIKSNNSFTDMRIVNKNKYVILLDQSLIDATIQE
jgi:hypothetical protein